jgi:quercetin dioxygenase-like cupin family protein
MPRSDSLTGGCVLAIAIGAAAASVTVALGQTGLNTGGSGERNVVAVSRFTVTNAPLQAELVQLVVDFPPDAWTSWHTHGGQAVNLVLEGEITLRRAGLEQPHRAGQAWTDSTGQVHAAGNTGRGKARLLTNFLLPKGAPQTTAVQESKFEPSILYEARFPLPVLPAEAEIVQQVADLVSGSRMEQASNGFIAKIVLTGEVAYTIGAEQKDYKAGQAWSAPPGTLVTEENKSGTAARVFATYLLPRGSGR